jgi:hypothetical protein
MPVSLACWLRVQHLLFMPRRCALAPGLQLPKSLDTIFGSAEKLSQLVKAMSGGKFENRCTPLAS